MLISLSSVVHNQPCPSCHSGRSCGKASLAVWDSCLTSAALTPLVCNTQYSPGEHEHVLEMNRQDRLSRLGTGCLMTNSQSGSCTADSGLLTSPSQPEAGIPPRCLLPSTPALNDDAQKKVQTIGTKECCFVELGELVKNYRVHPKFSLWTSASLPTMVNSEIPWGKELCLLHFYCPQYLLCQLSWKPVEAKWLFVNGWMNKERHKAQKPQTCHPDTTGAIGNLSNNRELMPAFLFNCH